MSVSFISILILSFIALVTDVKKRIVPNWLVGSGLATGLVYQLTAGSIWQGFGGLLLAFAITFPFFLLGGLGAGDVKLLMVIGLWTNATFFFYAFFWVAIIGALLTVLVMMVSSSKGKNVYFNLKFYFFYLLTMGRPPQQMAYESFTLPYCVPIFLGTAVGVAANL